MAEHASDYHRGDMEIEEHLVTYEAFNRLYKWGALLVASVIILFSTWLCAHFPLLASLVVTAIVLGLGIWVLTRKGEDNAEKELE